MCLLRETPTESNISHVAPDTLWAWGIYGTVIMIFENTVVSKGSISLQISSRRLHLANISFCQPFTGTAEMLSSVSIHKGVISSIVALNPSEGKSPSRVGGYICKEGLAP